MVLTGEIQGVYHSYLIRLWQHSGSMEAPGWRGEVIHIQTGETWSFSGYQPLLEFISTQMVNLNEQLTGTKIK